MPDANGEIAESLMVAIREIAQQQMRRERVGHTLQATAVAHEAWIRLAKQRNLDTGDRSHYLAAAATTIRRLLVEYARQKQAQKRGGEFSKVSLQVAEAGVANDRAGESVDLIALDEALVELSRLNERAGRVVELRFFSGLTMKEVADELSVSERSAYDDWKFARAWLLKQLG